MKMNGHKIALALGFALGTTVLSSGSNTAGAQEFFPRQAGSWGGVVRGGPGMNYSQIDGLQEGDPVTLLQNTGQWMNGYPWFLIRFKNGREGYQWGGIMCGIDQPVPGLHRTCTTTVNNGGNGGNNNGGPSWNSMFVDGASGGGIVRAGPGTNYRKITSTWKYEPITIIGRAGVNDQGFDWFQIRYRNGQVGYQSGGLLCSNNTALPGAWGTCAALRQALDGHSTNNPASGGQIHRHTIRFARGTSSESYQGGFARGDRAVYTLDASAGQNIYVSIGSNTNNAAFIVYQGGEGGPILGQSSNQWGGVLPRSGRYTIGVESTGGAVDYNLFVEVQ